MHAGGWRGPGSRAVCGSHPLPPEGRAPAPPPPLLQSPSPLPSLPLPTTQAVPHAPKPSSSSIKRQGRAGLQPWGACPPKLQGRGSRRSGVSGRVQVGLSLQLVHIVGVTLGPCPPPLPSTPCPQGESMPESDRRLTGARAGLRGAGSSRRLQDSACATGRNRGAREAGRGRPRWLGRSPVLSAPPRPPCGPSPVGIGCSFW